MGDFKRVFDILNTAHYGCVPHVYGVIKAKLYEVFELRRCELVKKRKPTLVQRLTRTRSVKEWIPRKSSIQKVSRWRPWARWLQQTFAYSIQTQRIQYQDKQVWISCTRPWKTFEWSAVSGNVRHWLHQRTVTVCSRRELRLQNMPFQLNFPFAESLLFICPCTSLVIYWETRSSGTNHKAQFPNAHISNTAHLQSLQEITKYFNFS